MTIHVLVPDALDTPSGGYRYDRRIIAELRAAGRPVVIVPVSTRFPFPERSDLEAAAAQLATLPDGSLVLADGLAFGAMPTVAEREAGRLVFVALVHHPLCLETGLAPQDAERLEASERAALAHARAVIVTAPTTAREVARRFAVAEDNIAVALPGTDPAARSTGGAARPNILSIGTLIPRKGHDILIAALERVKDLDWAARIIGSDAADPQTAAALRRQIAEAGLSGRIAMTGESDDTRGALATADLFALASRYEGYGMVFAEAMSQGVPIVACAAGPIPEVVPPEAGILVPPDDPDAFAEGLRRLLTDTGERRRLADGAHAAGQALPTWAETARIIAERLDAASRA